MKKYILILLGTWALCFHSCVKDDGNYSYIDEQEVLPGKVSGIAESYSVNTLQRLQIDPEIEEADPEATYSYCWYIFTNGWLNTFSDTLGYEKNLDYTVELMPGTYELVFKMTDVKTDISTIRATSLKVTSVYDLGWLIVKDDGTYTDIDFIKPDGEVIPEILKRANGESLSGKAVGCNYEGYKYYYLHEKPDGTSALEGKKAIYVWSDTDLRIYNADDMSLFYDYENSFFETPENRNPQDIIIGYGGTFLINSGKIHWIVQGWAGKFGAEVMGDYRIAPYWMHHMYYGMLVFDNVSSSFLCVPYKASSLIRLNSEPGQPDCNQMNYELIFMAEQDALAGWTEKAMALMKKKDAEEYYGLVLNTDWGDSKNPIRDLVQVPDGLKVTKAKMYAVNNSSNNDVIYFSDGQRSVGMYNVINGLENNDIITFDEGEKVSCMQHVTYLNNGSGDQDVDCFAVLTNSTLGWKLYLYHFVGKTAEIQTPAFQVYSGKGNARNMLYRGLESFNYL